MPNKNKEEVNINIECWVDRGLMSDQVDQLKKKLVDAAVRAIGLTPKLDPGGDVKITVHYEIYSGREKRERVSGATFLGLQEKPI
ncbi:MAG: hypothetical protein PHG22_00865 [Patescibacteria group bacterium]|nr:hypothetical protein [Patescibacteria group bacterium]